MPKGIRVSREEFLKAKPLRNPGLEWSEKDNRVHVTVPRKKGFLRNALKALLPSIRQERIVLDEQGSFIWNLCDGKTSIKAIVENLNTKYNMPIPNAEAALDVYFVQLSKKGVVGFALPESARRRYARKNNVSTKDKNRK